MHFDDPPAEAVFRAQARAGQEANGGPSRTREARAEPDVAEERAWQARKADAGWACITWPIEYGGRAASPIHSVKICADKGVAFRDIPTGADS